jgi:hypothetical protein
MTEERVERRKREKKRTYCTRQQLLEQLPLTLKQKESKGRP